METYWKIKTCRHSQLVNFVLQSLQCTQHALMPLLFLGTGPGLIGHRCIKFTNCWLGPDDSLCEKRGFRKVLKVTLRSTITPWCQRQCWVLFGLCTEYRLRNQLSSGVKVVFLLLHFYSAVRWTQSSYYEQYMPHRIVKSLANAPPYVKIFRNVIKIVGGVYTRNLVS